MRTPCLPNQHELQGHYQQDSENDPYCACSVRSLMEQTAHKFCNDSLTSYPRSDNLTWLTPGAPHFPEPSECRLSCCLNPALPEINHQAYLSDSIGLNLATRDQMREALQTDDGYMFEIHDDPILADGTRMWQDNEPVLFSSLRPADRRLTIKQRHEKLGHLGSCPGCRICAQVRGSLRHVYGSATPKHDPIPGRTWRGKK